VNLRLDPNRANHITVIGRKGTGKSELAGLFWRSWPFDRLVIDPNGDVRDVDDDDVQRLELPLPGSWPWAAGIDEREQRSTLAFRPDFRSPTFLDDMDRAISLALSRGRVLLWVDEAGELMKANRTPPHSRHLLHTSRHARVSVLLCMPRPVDVDPLTMSQADYIAAFELPSPSDRKRLADVIGLDLAELEAAHNELVEHGFLWWETRARELTVLPPLPLRRVA
jgi:hypothetical protein